METLILAATVVLTFVVFWLGRITERKGVKQYRRVVLWALAIGLGVTIVGASIVRDRMAGAERVRIATFRAELIDKIEKAEALAKAIPKGCPKDLDHEPWAQKVEDWRTETAHRLAPHGLDQAFAPDRGNYPHRPQCRIEWVRNRLDYFMNQLQAVLLALVKP